MNKKGGGQLSGVGNRAASFGGLILATEGFATQALSVQRKEKDGDLALYDMKTTRETEGWWCRDLRGRGFY